MRLHAARGGSLNSIFLKIFPSCCCCFSNMWSPPKFDYRRSLFSGIWWVNSTALQLLLLCLTTAGRALERLPGHHIFCFISLHLSSQKKIGGNLYSYPNPQNHTALPLCLLELPPPKRMTRIKPSISEGERKESMSFHDAHRTYPARKCPFFLQMCIYNNRLINVARFSGYWFRIIMRCAILENLRSTITLGPESD